MESRLPQEIIQFIQSFLNGKEAARTTVLSKSWYSAWSTRPNLDFDQFHFPYNSEEELLEFAKKTMQRYDNLNIKIHYFRMLMVESYDVRLAIELIVKAMKSGAVDLDITLWKSSFVLPDEVIRSETLTALSLAGSFQIDLAYLNCSQLKSLSLSVNVECDLFRDLISRFPLLEILKFDGHYSMYDDEGERFRPFSDDRINRNEGDDRKVPLLVFELEFDTTDYHFQKLEYLYLGHLIVEGNLFADASAFSKFPFLKELVIWDCEGLEDIRICSKSLERISIGLVEERRSFITEFDVPNIWKFKFEGSGRARLALKTARSKWESDIRVTCIHPSPGWFISLNELLKKLKGSKVSLSIKVMKEAGDCRWIESLGLARCLVENLTLEGCGVNPAFVHNLFSICRPKLIIREYSLRCDPVNESLLELVCERVLEEVKVELHQESSDDGRTFVLFRLRWPSADD